MNSPRKPREQSSGTIGGPISWTVDLLTKAISEVPVLRYLWGVVALAAVVAIVSFLNKITWISFVAMVAAFVAMLLFYVFAQFQRSSDIVVRWVGRLLLIITLTVFGFVIGSSMWLAMYCKPPLLAYLYGVADFCQSRIGAPGAAGETTKRSAFRNFVQKRGVWVGVDELPDAHTKHLRQFYEFTSLGDRLLEVRSTNGSGTCSVDEFNGVTGDEYGGACSAAGACRVKFSYKEDGSVDTQDLLDQAGNSLEKLQYATPSVGQFIDAVFPCDHGRSGIRLLRYELVSAGDNIGLTETVRFLDKDSHPRPNDAGFYGLRIKYQSGREIERTKLGPHGENFAPGSKPSIERVQYSEAGLKISKSYFDVDGTPSTDGGVHREEIKYDEWGNAIESRNLNVNGEPVRHSDQKTAGVRYKYDERGNRIEERYFGTDGQPTMFNDVEDDVTNRYAGYRRLFDARANQVSGCFLNQDGAVMLTAKGYACRNNKFDERNLEIEQAFVTADGLPVVSPLGYAVRLTKHDAKLNVTEHSFLGPDRAPIINLYEGATLVRFTYDERNKKIASGSFDSDGKPTAGTDGTASWKAEYDERGNELELRKSNLEGIPGVDREGVAGWRNKYDGNGNLVRRVYLGLKGQPVSSSNGYASVAMTIDEHGNEIRRDYFGEDGAATIVPEKDAAASTMKYDKRGNIIELVNLGLGGEPVGTGAVFVRRLEYDDASRIISRAFFGRDGKRTVNSQGIGGWRSKYDERGNEVQNDYIDTLGNATTDKVGAAGWRAKFDDLDQEIERFYVDQNGSLVPDSNGVAVYRWSYDVRGNQISNQYYGRDGKRVIGNDKIAGTRSEYEKRNKKISHFNLGIDGEPLLGEDHTAGWRKTYDPKGNQVEVSYLDAKGAKVATNTGEAMVRYEYDDRGREVIRRLFDVSGDPVAAEDTGRAIIRTYYNSQNLKLRESSFDAAGNPVNRLDEKWHSKEWIYDDNGRLLKTVLKDSNGIELTNSDSNK
ncbi:YD repeat-containing protein [Bradyrhizobium sp. S3.3.6]|uniref:hypothetical protein n=1 Tax=Bradyrhizobium sp. S3.3.6 TaxID=3156429 RepID=UPI003397393F